MDSIVKVTEAVVDSGAVTEVVAEVAQTVDVGVVADTVAKMAAVLVDSGTVSAVAEANEVMEMTINGSLLVSVTGMLIVFAALAVIAIIISQLPALMKLIAKVVPEAEPKGKKKPARKQVASSDDEAVAVAIALANHTAKGK